ncbi:MAG TPA: hypothetical protein VIC27_13505 [Ktedonobacterales bacterium]
MAESIEELYPHIARWVTLRGYVNIGHDDDSFHPAFVRALDAGGMIWEGDPSYPTLDDALRALDDAIRDWLREQGTVE